MPGLYSIQINWNVWKWELDTGVFKDPGWLHSAAKFRSHCPRAWESIRTRDDPSLKRLKAKCFCCNWLNEGCDWGRHESPHFLLDQEKPATWEGACLGAIVERIQHNRASSQGWSSLRRKRLCTTECRSWAQSNYMATREVMPRRPPKASCELAMILLLLIPYYNVASKENCPYPFTSSPFLPLS